MGLILPQSADQLLETLSAIFPECRTGYSGPIHDDTATFHSVLIAFTPYFGARVSNFSERQLRTFGELVNAAIEQTGPLENAFSTCLLEHLHQIQADGALRTYLSKNFASATVMRADSKTSRGISKLRVAVMAFLIEQEDKLLHIFG